MILPLKRGGNEFMEAESPIGTKEDLDETLREIRRLSPAAVVVDSPNADEDYLGRLAKAAPLVVTLDHHAAHHFPSRLVVNPLLGPSREAYDHGDRTQLLLGERYALIRSEIRRLRPLRSQEPQTPFRVAVALSEKTSGRASRRWSWSPSDWRPTTVRPISEQQLAALASSS
ncbi:MAG: hypothetical protein ACKOS8_07570, partial [Gemmataceae bacterium]